MESKNLYEILGLKPTASREEIKNAYRKLVRIYHPDVNKTKEAETYFKMLNNAVETLLDDTKRLQYDRVAGISGIYNGDVKKERPKKNASPENENFARDAKHPESKTNKDFSDDKTSKSSIFSTFFKDTNAKKQKSKDFNAGKNPETKAKSQGADGKDIETVVSISKSEQKRGTIRKINVLHTDKCPKCAGVKYINGSVCALCHGAGEKSEHKIMTVKIPAGIKAGVKMKIKGEGEYGKFGGKNGDLYLLIQINENEPETTESGIIEAVISPWEAVLGGTIRVKTEYGEEEVKILPLTKTGTRFKLKKSGYTALLKVDIPENITKEEIDLYKKLREIAEKNDKNLQNS